MKPIPLLFISDSPELVGGLSRITRELAQHVCALPEFRVGTLGRGGIGCSNLPWAQYNFDESRNWGEGEIERVWSDFAGSQRGIVFTVWDATRLGWLSQPSMGGTLETFLRSGKFEKWAYVPVDSHGIGGKLTGFAANALRGFNRVLAYTIFGKQVIEASIGREVDWIPHGISTKAFQPRGKDAGRAILGIDEHDVLISCVMTNQTRKDWGTAFGAVAKVKDHIPNLKFWCHTDVLTRHWNLHALVEDFGLSNTVKITDTAFTNEQMSYLYSAGDLTILPSLAEGFGYPIVESQACGVAVVHTDYAGGAQFVASRDWLVFPQTWRLDGPWNCVRPVLDPEAWADKIRHVLRETAGGLYRDECVRAVENLDWQTLWPVWRKWMLEGVGK